MESEVEDECFWITFVHTSTESRDRQKQWEELKRRRLQWGSRWIVGGDFNDIKNQEEKKGGNARLEGSFSGFRNFILDMGMGDLGFKGDMFTWVNNREGEGYI